MATMSEYVQTHKPLVIGGGLAILVVAGYYLSKKGTTTATTPGATADLSGLTNGLVYVPTSTNFTTENQSGVFASNDPNLTSLTTGATNSPITTTTKTNNRSSSIIGLPPSNNPPPPPPRAPAPNPAPAPATGGGLLGPGVRFFPDYKDGLAYYRGPSTGGKILLVPLPPNTKYIPGASGRVWYQSPPGSTQKLLTSG
jgi:hypothetical protein